MYFNFLGNQLATILTGPVITAAMGFPENVASKLLQQHVDKTLQGQSTMPIEINQVITQANNVQQQMPVQNQVCFKDNDHQIMLLCI